jgi:hypothetical protein
MYRSIRATVFCLRIKKIIYSDRWCQSPEETFFNRHSRLRIGSTEYCPNNMELFDGLNNEGFCAYQPVEASASSSPGFQAPCPRGTQRDQFGVCRRGYIG